MKLHRSITGFFLMILLILAAQAASADYKVIDTTQLKAMFDDKKNFTLIDARTKEEYNEAHIVKAINVTEKGFETQASQLPVDKSALLIIYCNGVKCGKSKKVAKKSTTLGYTNILLYAEGFPVWEEKTLPITAGPNYSKRIETAKLKPAELKQLIDNGAKDFVIVDVRDETEYREGHIPGAINISVETFATRSEILPKEKKIIVYCNSGGRSYTAYKKLVKLAYPNIFQAIFADWKEAGLQVER
ncbi:MAG: rhodanese-like domain-containing protein [Nitrospiraceae bacterium]|nr:rhodanese-like domain-containing protein [Nitrospiraceae bacterium]